jgi:hypothetical protein
MKENITNTADVLDFGVLPNHPRLTVPVTVLKGINTHPERKITLGELLSEIETTDITKLNASQSIVCIYEAYLEKAKANEKSAKEVYDKKKKTLNGFILGNFIQRSDEKTNCVEYVPCLVFDLDGCKSTYDCFLYQNKLKEMDYIFAAFPSPSGYGLRILVWTNSTWETHRIVYQQVIERLCKELDVTDDRKKGTHFDSTCQNESRHFFYVAVDKKNFYLNLESKNFESLLPEISKEDKKGQKRNLENNSDTCTYIDALNDDVKIDFILKTINMNKPRKLQCFDFGCLCCENNVDFNKANRAAQQHFYDDAQKNPEKVITTQLKEGYDQTHARYTDEQFAALLYKKFDVIVNVKKNRETTLEKGGQEEKTPILDLQTKYPTEAFYNRLPKILRTCTDALQTETDKHVFFWGALPAISSICYDVSGIYDKKQVFASYYSYIVATGGAGKGALDYARQLVLGVAEQLQAENENKTPKKTLFVPTNVGNTQLVQKLQDNGARGLFFETEGGIVAKMAKSENMDLSDTLRKGFHHEMILLGRKMDKLDIAMEKLRLSVVISGTFSQLLPTIKDGEDGLFSRFNYLYLTGNYEFKNVFDRQNSKNVMAIFAETSKKMVALYELLQNQKVSFELTEAQELHFLAVFKERKAYVMKYLSGRGDVVMEIFSGVMNRIGVMAFRTAMLLTVLRYFEEEKLGKSENLMICNEDDFKTAIDFAELGRNNALAVFERLPQPSLQIKNESLDKADFKSKHFQEAVDLKKTGKSYAEIARVIFGDEKLKGTIHRWLK